MTDTEFMTYDAMVAALLQADWLYYNDPDNATLSDADYDSMYADVVRIEAETGGHASNSPTQRVRGTASLKPTRHAAPMLSLENAMSPEELSKFLANVTDKTGFYVEPKLDGASLSLEFEEGKLVRALTRGDGTTGDDVTTNALLIRGVPSELTVGGEPFDGWVRGEVVIRTKDFAEINVDNRFANARNAASGALRHSDPMEARRRRLTFYPYDSSDGTGHVQNIDGFLQYPYTPCFINQVPTAVAELLQRRADGGFEFETDGLVVKVTNRDVREKLGVTGKHPKWAVAYKTIGQLVETTVADIKWQTGAGGQVTPVMEFVPVECGGVTITFATGHNIDWMLGKGVCVGASVMVRRMGDTIPGVESVVSRNDGERPQVPKTCSDCESLLVQDGNSGQVHCPDDFGTCVPQIVGRMIRWASREAADIEGFGPAWVEALVRDGKLRYVTDFYHLTHDDLAPLERRDEEGKTRRLGDKLAAKLIERIEASKGLGLRRALIGLSIPTAGEGTAKRLCEHFTSLEGISEPCRIDLGGGAGASLRSIKDIGDVVAGNIIEFFQAYGSLVSDLRIIGVDLNRLPEDAPVVKTASSRNFVVTGSFEGYKSRKEPVAILEQAGWTSQSSMSTATHYLVSDDPSPTSSKAKKAATLGVETITMARAMELAGVS